MPLPVDNKPICSNNHRTSQNPYPPDMGGGFFKIQYMEKLWKLWITIKNVDKLSRFNPQGGE